MLTAGSGVAFSLSLIVAVGAQNAFLLRQGLRGEHVGLVVRICAASDVALIAAGIAGMGALITGLPQLLTAIKVLGLVFLLGYGLLALRRALRPEVLEAAATTTVSRRSVIVTTLALTYLNPGVYIDTVILLGSIANSRGSGGSAMVVRGGGGAGQRGVVRGAGVRRPAADAGVPPS